MKYCVTTDPDSKYPSKNDSVFVIYKEAFDYAFSKNNEAQENNEDNKYYVYCFVPREEIIAHIDNAWGSAFINGKVIPEIHISDEDGEGVFDLTGYGFFKRMREVKDLIVKEKITCFGITACTEKRQKCFNWIAKKWGCTIKVIKDVYDEDYYVAYVNIKTE